MKRSESVKFSIIVCAHDRSDFVIPALKSALEQDFPEKEYELILVKNFKNKRIDSFTEKNGIVNILTEKGPLMQKMMEGVSISKGEYLCFLEDDDLFEKNKLKRIGELIDNDGSLSYYHSSFTVIDENGKSLKHHISRTPVRTMIYSGESDILSGLPEMLKFRADWYGSMMCIRKGSLLAHFDQLKQIEGSADRIIFYMGLLDSRQVIIDSTRTTKYRLHKSHTTVIAEYDNFMSKKNAFYTKSFESAKILETICKSGYLEPLSKCYVLHEKILSRFTNRENFSMDGIRIGEVIECFGKVRTKNILIWYSLLLAKSLFGNSVLKLYYIMSSHIARKGASS